jgi:hypothetical protein
MRRKSDHASGGMLTGAKTETPSSTLMRGGRHPLACHLLMLAYQNGAGCHDNPMGSDGKGSRGFHSREPLFR